MEAIQVSVPRLHPLDDYLRTDRLPHTLCPGCGIGIALNAFLRAVNELSSEGKLDRRNILFIGGIGCTARMSMYTMFDSAHVTHGRAIPFATGARLANPNIIPVVFSGDGDLAGIGGNHLIHAARRNMDLLVVVINNMTYGLTGGQLSPTTPTGHYTTTTPYGNPERPFNLVPLIAAAGGNYVARASITQPEVMKSYFKKALIREGFRFIEVVSTCPENYGRHLGYKSPADFYLKIKEVVKMRSGIKPWDAKYDWSSEITIGEFIDRNEPGFSKSLYEQISKVRNSEN
ncbi:MAG: thiamine pyrophosphate-dependent enzyme [Thermocladium sp.]